jgi:hypothetical protein
MMKDRGSQVASTIGQLREVGAEVDARQGQFTGVKLSAVDAKQLVEQRRRERIAAQKAVRPSSAAAPAPSGPAAPTAEEGGLAAAKRRARERFESDQ